jgi:beta-galactosidase/beta-glucuronidase
MIRTRPMLVWAIFVITVTTCGASWKPAGEKIRTRFAKDVTPDNAWREYPRPQMVRMDWQSLNGLWHYQVRARGGDYAEMSRTLGEGGDGDILVPYCIESSLSGVGRLLAPEEELWYQRQFEVSKTGHRLILHFEAVDYECAVWVNGKSVGTHKGGNNPFLFDITDAATDGVNHVSVRVWDETGGYQLSGKQVMKPRGIFYTRVSGIWQTVWLETVPATYIKTVKIDTSHDPAQITVQTVVGGDASKADGVRVTAYLDGKKVASRKGRLDKTTLAIKNARLWSPSQPTLYDLTVELLSGRKPCDSVKSYTGIRRVGKQKDADGHWRFTLNGEEIFHLGPLDQGWYPDGLLTPASEAAMLFDIQYLKDSGFNMIRNHIKVRPRRYYYHCDRLGLMVWQDQVSTRYKKPQWTRMQEDPNDGDWDDEAHAQFMAEFKEMIDCLYNAPCIVMWIPFNESWGQHRTMEIGNWTVQYDPSRLVNVASGGNYWPVGDVADHHSYPHPGFPLDDKRFDDYVKVVGEFGGHGFVVDKTHLWNPDARNWGYGGLPKDQGELMGRYIESFRRMKDLKQKGIAAGVYTQTSDVEGEVNGLLTYDRAVEKFPRDKLNLIHTELYAVPVDMKRP